MTTGWIPVAFVLAMTIATIGLGLLATRRSKTASDFFVAGRSVSVFWNASAISGEYLSAASFLGIAGLLMKNGYDALWYPVCYATGYLFLLLFIAGPLRRFGAYTIPDFAEGRFDSPAFRKVAVSFVLFIGFFYTMPQMKGAGLTMGAILNWPYWAGIVVVGTVITFNVALGGMKGITFVQAFQYWAKVFAISAPVFVLATVFGGYDANLAPNGVNPHGAPKTSRDVKLKFKESAAYPANVLAFSKGGDAEIEFPDGATLAKVSEKGVRGFDAGTPPTVPSGGVLHGGPSRWEDTFGPTKVLETGRAEFRDSAIGILKSGSTPPNSPTNETWLRPFGPLTSKHGHPLLYTYSLIMALICGTAGLPHILVRFYTNPDGRAAKRTTLWVMVMLGAFYVFPPFWGAMGRQIMPELYANNATDTVVIRLPTILANPLLGQILTGVTSAGAFAAFMSTFSGLLVSMSGALAHDIYGKILRPNASQASRLTAFKVSAVLIGLTSMGLGFLVESFDIAMMVGWAFAIGACSYFPLLLLGSWWSRLTKFGAGAGMLVGGFAALIAIVTSMLLDKKILTFEVTPLVRSLLEQPAIWGVPLSISLMVVVSLLTSNSLPSDVHLKMLRLHAPEEMGLSKNYIVEH